MSRWIDADALKEDLLINHNTDLMAQSLVLGSGFDVGVDYVMQFIEDAPSIDLVRCAECKHWCKGDDVYGICYRCPNTRQMRYDDFCSYGERREDE